MRYLIDGYNLLHALGLARRGGGRSAWDAARRQLLDWLADQLGGSTSAVTVVFDAQHASGGLVEERHRGLRILRDRGRSADDLIEDLLRADGSPETLTVVSNDARIREAAARRGAGVRRCGEFVDGLIGPRRSWTGGAPTAPGDEKPPGPTAEEEAEWLRRFGD